MSEKDKEDGKEKEKEGNSKRKKISESDDWRRHIEPFLKYIRFSQMKIAFITSTVRPACVLPPEQLNRIYALVGAKTTFPCEDDLSKVSLSSRLNFRPRFLASNINPTPTHPFPIEKPKLQRIGGGLLLGATIKSREGFELKEVDEHFFGPLCGKTFGFRVKFLTKIHSCLSYNFGWWGQLEGEEAFGGAPLIAVRITNKKLEYYCPTLGDPTRRNIFGSCKFSEYDKIREISVTIRSYERNPIMGSKKIVFEGRVSINEKPLEPAKFHRPIAQVDYVRAACVLGGMKDGTDGKKVLLEFLPI